MRTGYRIHLSQAVEYGDWTNCQWVWNWLGTDRAMLSSYSYRLTASMGPYHSGPSMGVSTRLRSSAAQSCVLCGVAFCLQVVLR